LQIDDEGKVIEAITDRMRKLPHVPVQTWKGWDLNDLFGGCFSALDGFKTLIAANRPNPRSMLNTALPGPPGIVVYQDYYGGHCRKENGLTGSDAMLIQTPRSRWCSLTIVGSEHQRGE
jgi:hypothetical protein